MIKKYGIMLATVLLCLIFCVPVEAAGKETEEKKDEIGWSKRLASICLRT